MMKIKSIIGAAILLAGGAYAEKKYGVVNRSVELSKKAYDSAKGFLNKKEVTSDVADNVSDINIEEN